MEMRLPQDKIIELTNHLKICLDAKKVSLRDLLSLLGLLNFTTAWLSTLKIIRLFFKCIPQMCTEMTTGNNSKNVISARIPLSAHSFGQQPWLPQDKIIELTNRLKICLDAKKVSLRDLQSLLGLLNFACQVVAPGRAFSRRNKISDKGHNSIGFWRLFVNNSYHCLIINIKNNSFIF
jgi:hypothetical protein